MIALVLLALAVRLVLPEPVCVPVSRFYDDYLCLHPI